MSGRKGIEGSMEGKEEGEGTVSSYREGEVGRQSAESWQWRRKKNKTKKDYL